jgi:hypothetical protein
VTGFSYGSASESSAAFTLLILFYLLIALTGTSNLTILVLKMTPAGFGREDFQPRTAFRKCRDAIRGILTQSWSFQVLTRTWILLTIIYGYFIGPLAVVDMVAYMEWMMNSDPGGESFRHVGQWGALVGTILVVAVAIAPVVFKRIQSYF